MEKEVVQPDSITTVTIKPDYPPSEVYSSEPPPAYHRSQSSAVQVAKIIAVTVVLMSVILGGFLLASAYVTANASCRQLEEELELLNEAADKFQAPLQPEALTQDEPLRQKQRADSLKSKEPSHINNEINNSIDSAESDNSDNSDSGINSSSSSESEEEEKTPIHFKLPLQLDFDDLAGALIEKNQKSRMNCIVEKKRAEEVVDHQPKTIRLPFGLNLTTDPRFERISGERMAIFCESGNSQRREDPEENDSEEETIMIQPVMIPIPQSHFPTHMAQQLRPVPQQNVYHPMEAMRPPIPPFVQNHEPQSQLPPNQVLHHIAQQIIAQKIMEARQAREEQQNQGMRSSPEQSQTYSVPEEVVAERISVPEEVLTQLNRLPNRDVIVTVSRHQSEDMPHGQQEMHIEPQEIRMIPQEIRPVSNPVSQETHTIPQDMRGNPQDSNGAPQEMRGVPDMQVIKVVPQEMHVLQQQRDNTQEINDRQTYARGLPVHIPVHMIQQEQDVRPAPSEETRPHYVQPRSVRSLDGLLNKSQKRVKRCSCDCAC